ncbi:MAG: T9SS type A sorting domain-containing protein [Bacteroidia bacterium]
MNHLIRKSIPFASIILGSFSALCQISINATNMPSAGDTIRYSVVQNSAGFDFKASGENKAWDFKNLKSTSQDIYQYKNSTTTPYVLNFGFSALGLKLADSLGSGQMGLKDVYTFFKKSTTKWEAVGIGFQLSALPLPQAGKHTNSDEIYTFPLNFKDKDSTAFTLKVPISAVILPLGNYFQDGNRVNTVDGWGKISTPYQSDVECIRIKSVITETDSLAIAISGQAPINFAFPNNRVEYKWLSKTEKIPMLEVSGNVIGATFTPTIVRYRDNYRSNKPGKVQSILNPNLVAFPNPAKDKVTLEIPSTLNGSFYLFVFDMTGKNMASIDFNTYEKIIELNTTNLTSGLYTVLIGSNNLIYYSSINILK